jgi:2'-5' RNA ligase
LWPDDETRTAIAAVWAALAERGIPSMATHTHGLHQPHVSLFVAEDLPVDEVLGAIGSVPKTAIELRIEAAGVFPGGLLYLAPVASNELLKEQGRVQTAVEPLASRPWPHFEKGAWIPHITTGWFLNKHEMAAALPLVLDALPLLGCLDRGGIEDGTTGENWPVAPAS